MEIGSSQEGHKSRLYKTCQFLPVPPYWWTPYLKWCFLVQVWAWWKKALYAFHICSSNKLKQYRKCFKESINSSLFWKTLKDLRFAIFHSRLFCKTLKDLRVVIWDFHHIFLFVKVSLPLPCSNPSTFRGRLESMQVISVLVQFLL